jgi:hypothetical protein
MAGTEIQWNILQSDLPDYLDVSSKLLPRVASDVADQAFAYSLNYRLWRHTGTLTASIGWVLGRDPIGPYADVGGVWYGRFLDPKARQLHYLRPLFPSSLDIINGRTY